MGDRRVPESSMRAPPRFLLTNDDGYRAPGLTLLAAGLRELGSVVIVAPDRNRSGASNSLTLDVPIRATREADDVYIVTGTPTDCVHVAVTGLLDAPPHLVVSGINEGPNLGDDVLYSGTVAAAMEGRLLGLPALAVSLAGERPTHYDTAVQVVRSLVAGALAEALPADTLLNVNVPDVRSAAIVGIWVTRLGQRHKSEPAVRAVDTRGRPVFWIGAPGAAQDAGPGTDFHAVESGAVSVTPLTVDLTRHDSIDNVRRWLQSIDSENV